DPALHDRRPGLDTAAAGGSTDRARGAYRPGGGNRPCRRAHPGDERAGWFGSRFSLSPTSGISRRWRSGPVSLRAMDVHIALPNGHAGVTVDELIEITVTAEELGFAGVWPLDHVLVGPDLKDRYPWVVEPMTLLAYLAARTR